MGCIRLKLDRLVACQSHVKDEAYGLDMAMEALDLATMKGRHWVLPMPVLLPCQGSGKERWKEAIEGKESFGEGAD